MATPLFTGRGDTGQTDLLVKSRVFKYEERVEALGTIDEASAAIGLARASVKLPSVPDLLLAAQRDLYHIMAEVSASPDISFAMELLKEERVEWLESSILELEERLGEIPLAFIIPGGTPASAALALARTIVRRAERRMVELYHNGKIKNELLIRYLNRLSSLLFTLELTENKFAEGGEKTVLANQ